MTRIQLLAVLVGFCLIGRAEADWDVIGAAWACDGKQNLFSLVEATDASDEALAVHPPDGFERLPQRQSRLSCKLSSAKVEAIVSVYPPAARGMGRASGYVSVDKMEVDGLPVLGFPTAFNWEILGSPKALTKIAVFIQGNAPFVQICNTEACDQVSLAANRLLNQTYQEIMSALPESDRQALRQEQRFWLKERNPRCQTAALHKQNEPLAFLRCLVSATEDRTIRLRQLQRPR